MIIKSLLDTDLYKFTMMQAVLHQHPNVDVEYNFIVRSKEKLGHLIPELRAEIGSATPLEGAGEHEVRRFELRNNAFVRAMLAHRPRDVVAVRFEPQEAFDQTPGPHAGSPVER